MTALRACAAASAAVLVLIALFLVGEALPVLAAEGPLAFLRRTWLPSDGRYGLLAMAAGSLLVALGAVAVAGPLGVAAAVFCRHYAPPPVAAFYRRVLELLAGVPSVVYGFWGLAVLVPLVARIRPPGPSLLAGIAVLSVMILPTVAITAEAALAGVPDDVRRAAAALGLSRWTAVRAVLLPAAASGIASGVVLALGRAIGETMAVVMVCGNAVQVPSSLFDPVRTLTANIALEMAYATGPHRSALFAGGLLLLVVVAGLVILARRPSRG